MKRFFLSTFVFCLAFASFSAYGHAESTEKTACTVTSNTIYVHPLSGVIAVAGQEIAFDPHSSENITYLPVRSIAEALGYTVEWDVPSRSASLTRNDENYRLPADQITGYSATGHFTMQHPCKISNGVLLAPVDFFSTVLGLHIVRSDSHV